MKSIILAAAAALMLTPLALADDPVPTGSDAFSGSQQTVVGGSFAGSALFGHSEASSSNFASTHGGSASGAFADEDSTFTFASDHRTTFTAGESESGAFGASIAGGAEARAVYGEQFSSAHAEVAEEDEGWGDWWD